MSFPEPIVSATDLTRTFAVGKVDEEYRKIHQIVMEANSAGRAAAQPGMPCAQVDSAARTVIEKAGYGQYFTHRTGHGIGMEAHEDPYIRGDAMQLLTPGMTWQGDGGVAQMRRGVVFPALAQAGFTDLALERFGFFPPALANRRAAAAIEERLEAFSLLRPILPFQLFRGSKRA